MTQTKAELLQTRHQGDLKLGDADSSNYVGFKAPATVGSNLVWTLPATDGSANQFLQTNASGVLGWGTADVSSAMPLTGGTFTGDVTFDGATAGRDIVFDRSDNALEFADNAKASFGTGSDVLIYHNGSHNYIEATNGNTYLWGGGAQLKAVFDGQVELYFDGTKKFETTSAGVSITGAATISTNLTVTGDLTVSGTTTTINTQTLDVEDKNVVIGKVSSPSDTTADGGGWTLKGATDKTFNWVNSTDAWTSSEHIHLIDNKKLLIGTGQDLRILHDATNSYIHNYTGQLVIQNDTTNASNLFIKAKSGENSIVAIPDGAVELYHNSAKKIETTSGGINVTGAINVNGSALSTAPQITATADGAITAGKTCIITTAGKAAQVAAAQVGINPVTRNSDSEENKSGTGGEYLQGTYAECVAYDPDSDTVAVALREDSAGNAKFYLFSSSGDDLNYHTVERVLDSNSNRSGSMSVTALPGRRFIGTYYDSANSGTTKVVIFTVNSNGDGWSAGSTTALKANGCYTDAIFGIHTTGGRVAFAVRGTGTSQLTNGRMALICGDAGTTGSTWTYRSFSDNIFGEPTSYCISLDYDSTNDVIGVQAGNSSLMEIIGMRIAAGTGANISKGTKYTLTTSSLNDSRHICKHVSGTTFVSQWAAGTNGPIYLNTTTINSSLAISNGSQYSLSGSGNNGGVGLDVTNEGRLLLGWQHNDGVAKVKQYTLSGTTLTALSGETEILTSLLGKDRFAFRYMGHNGMIAAFTTRGASGLGRGTADTTEDGSNMTAENYIGIAASTVSDGAAATIDVSGATNSSQSSLTPGQKYFVQANGTLGLTAAASPTAEVFAGTAIAATKIIVNDQAPAYVPPSGWTVINSEYIQTGHTTDPIISESLSSAYKMYRVQFYFVFAASGLLGLRMKHSGSWQTSNYWYQTHRASGGSVEDGFANNNANRLYAGGSRMGRIMNGSITFGNVHSTNQHKTFSMVTGMASELINGWATNTFVDHSFGGHNSTAAVTGLRFHCSDLSEGWFVLEGLAI